MVKEAYDYSEFTGDKIEPGANMLARISGLASDQAHAAARVERLTEELKQAKETFRHISENQMPLLMEEAQVDSFTTKDGLKIEIKEAIRGSIPKATQVEAFKWLEDNGHGRLIKREFKIDFGKDDDKWADKFERDCAKRKKPLNLKRKKSVHPQTLLSFVKGQLEEGVPIPMDTFGVYRQNFAKVTVKT